MRRNRGQRARGGSRRRVIGVVAAAAMLVTVLPAAASAQTPPDGDDPRVGLAPGWSAAEEVGLGVELLSNTERPPGFFDPGNPGSFSFAQSDLALTDTHAYVGSFHGFNIYDISDPEAPELVNATVCPGGQGDTSIYGDLLFVSVEEARARVDCGTDPTVGERFQGVRIFDVSDATNPQQVAAVQACRGSHTHTLVDDPSGDSVYVYVSGTTGVRPDGDDIGLNCETVGAGEDPLEDDARWRIDIIEVPLDAPEDAELIGGPRLFEDESGIDGLQQQPPTEEHPSGEPWGPTPITDACHDITAYPAVGLAAGACEGNGILIDITDPENPTRVSDAADPNFAYWHSATFNDAGDKVIFTDEWGGGTGARCRESDALEWGANAIFDVVEGDDGLELEFASYYKMPAVQTDTENCVAHNGNLLPHPERDLFLQAWYQGGLTVVDFTDSANPHEIAYFDRGPISAANLTLGGYWSTYFHNGYIYGAEIARGFDVLQLTPTDDLTQDEIDIINSNYYGENNPQLQKPLFSEEPPEEPPVEPGPAACDDVEPVSYPDVSGTHAANIGCVGGYGIARGYADGTFGPRAEVRRDQMASFIHRTLTVAGVELPEASGSGWSDVGTGVHSTAIGELTAAGVIQGHRDGTFDPGGSVSRGQTASLVVRALEYAVGRDLSPQGDNPFTDTAGAHTDNITVAWELSITQGRTDTTFEPRLPVSREQMASLLARSLDVYTDEGFDLTPIG